MSMIVAIDFENIVHRKRIDLICLVIGVFASVKYCACDFGHTIGEIWQGKAFLSVVVAFVFRFEP